MTATPGNEPGWQDVGDHYDDAYYADLEGRYLKRNAFARHRIRNVMRLLPSDLKGKTVLDLGTGMGTFVFECASRGALAIGLDPFRTALDAAQRIERITKAARVGWLQADAAFIPVRAKSVNAVILADFTEHLDTKTLHAVFVECRRVLRPGGTMALYTPDPAHIFEAMRRKNFLLKGDPSHIGLRGPYDLAMSLGLAGFDIVEYKPRPSHIPIFNWFERLLTPLTSLARRRVCIRATPSQ